MVGIYVPNTDQVEFWEELYPHLDVRTTGELFIFGDFNTVINSWLDRSRVTTTPDISPWIYNLLTDLRVVDIWRENHPGVQDYTFFSAHYQSYSRIDMIWGTTNLLSQTKEIHIGNRIYSDHAPIIMV